MTAERINSQEFTKKFPFVQVMGVTASGKTTLLELLKKRLGYQIIPEMSVKDNPIFKQYYNDPEKFALGAQILFAFNNYIQLKGSENFDELGVKKMLVSGSVASEPPIWQDALYAQARMQGRAYELSKYMDFYQGLISADNFLLPDLLVHLKISLPTMLKRIINRARLHPERRVELKEKRSYWRALWELDEGWVAKNPLNLNIVTLNMDRFTYSKNRSPREVDDKILQKLKSLSEPFM